ncbi:MAG: transcription initiation factor IIB [Bogoriella megaspora]|nr:MAG: transcription initiation factor IIB [Bogoriella megaspora]
MATTNGVRSPGAIAEALPVKASENDYQENLNIHLICPDCREVPPNLTEDFTAGDTICATCGLVLGSRIVDTRSEWRTFANDDQGNDDPSRVGEAANPLLEGAQLDTAISFNGGSAAARDLTRAQAKNINEKGQKNLMHAYKQIGAICDAHHIQSTVTNTAKLNYKMVDDAKLLKGKSSDAVIASCIFLACRQHAVPRSFREVHEMCHVSKKEIGRTFKMIEKFVNKEASKSHGLPAAVAGIPAEENGDEEGSGRAPQMSNRFCSKLGLPRPCPLVAEELAERVGQQGLLVGRSPLSVAAACIYMTAHLMGHPKSPKEVGAICGVSDGTIRTSYKHLYEARNSLVADEWITQRNGDMRRLPSA